MISLLLLSPQFRSRIGRLVLDKSEILEIIVNKTVTGYYIYKIIYRN